MFAFNIYFFSIIRSYSVYRQVCTTCHSVVLSRSHQKLQTEIIEQKQQVLSEIKNVVEPLEYNSTELGVPFNKDLMAFITF